MSYKGYTEAGNSGYYRRTVLKILGGAALLGGANAAGLDEMLLGDAQAAEPKFDVAEYYQNGILVALRITLSGQPAPELRKAWRDGAVWEPYNVRRGITEAQGHDLERTLQGYVNINDLTAPKEGRANVVWYKNCGPPVIVVTATQWTSEAYEVADGVCGIRVSYHPKGQTDKAGGNPSAEASSAAAPPGATGQAEPSASVGEDGGGSAAGPK